MDAFKSAVINKESAVNKFGNQISSGIKDVGIAIAGAVGLAGMVGKAAAHTLANRVGGVGGNLMLGMMNNKLAEVGPTQEMIDKASGDLTTSILEKGGEGVEGAVEALKRLTPSAMIKVWERQNKRLEEKDMNILQSFIGGGNE